jgi:hypothetical protein
LPKWSLRFRFFTNNFCIFLISLMHNNFESITFYITRNLSIMPHSYDTPTINSQMSFLKSAHILSDSWGDTKSHFKYATPIQTFYNTSCSLNANQTIHSIAVSCKGYGGVKASIKRRFMQWHCCFLTVWVQYHATPGSLKAKQHATRSLRWLTSFLSTLNSHKGEIWTQHEAIHTDGRITPGNFPRNRQWVILITKGGTLKDQQKAKHPPHFTI